MSYKFKVGDKGKTRDGRAYVVVLTDLKNKEFPMVVRVVEASGAEDVYQCTEDGAYDNSGVAFSADILPPTREVVVERWLVYCRHISSPDVQVFMFEQELKASMFVAYFGRSGGTHLRTVCVKEVFEIPMIHPTDD